jgi:hypothetical protein
MEFRGSGMDKAAFLSLLGRLVPVNDKGLEQSLDERFVTDAERPAAIATILDEMGTALPAGVDRGSITSEQPDRYHLGADVAGGVACAWLDEFSAATAAGDTGRADVAAAALQESKQWPILLEMDERGGYPEVLWEYADRVAAGTVPDGYEGGLGCH